MIAIQQAAGSVSASSCGRYFRTLGHVQKIDLQIILKLEALQRIMQLETITKFQIKLAGIDSGRPFRATDDSARNMMKFLRSMKAPTASITVAVDRETPTLERVARLVEDALEWDRSGVADVKKLLVTGSEGDADEIAAIDLMRDRIVETVPVELADGQRITDNDRYDAVRTAWDRQQPALEGLFGAA